MPRFNSYTLPTVHTWVSGATTNVDLPRSGFITHIDHLLRADITAAGGATALEDGLSRILHAYRISAAGSKNFFSITDGRQWFWWMFHRYLGQLHVDAVPTVGANNIVRMYLPLHLGFDPLNIFDGKVVIPARDLQNLTTQAVWGPQTDIGAAQTINALTLTLNINEVALEPGENVAQFFPAGFLLPRFQVANDPLTVQANLGFNDNVPVGDTLYQSTLLVIAAAGTKSDADASEIGVKFPKVRETPMQIDWHTFVKQQRAIMSLPATQVGVGLFLWERISRSPFGLDLKLAQAGDVQLALTTLLGTGTWQRLHYALG